MENTIIFFQSNYLNLLNNHNVETIKLFNGVINLYKCDDNINVNNNILKLIKNQFIHIQYNQLIIIKFCDLNNLFYIDCYNSFTSKQFYKSIPNYLISNKNLDFRLSPRRRL